MNTFQKNWLLVVSIIFVIAVATTAVFASKYYKTEERRAAEALKVAELDHERLSRTAPTVSSDMFDCTLPPEMRSLEYKNVHFSILSTDIASAEKAIVAILKKYPGASEGISNSNYEYTSQLPQNNHSSISMNGTVPSAVADSIISDIQKLAKSDFIISSKNINSTSSEGGVNICNSNLIHVQSLSIKESIYLDQLNKGNLDSESLNMIANELSNVRSEFLSFKNSPFTSVKKTLGEASFSINISILKG